MAFRGLVVLSVFVANEAVIRASASESGLSYFIAMIVGCTQRWTDCDEHKFGLTVLFDLVGR